MSVTTVREHEPAAKGAVMSEGISFLPVDDVDAAPTQREIARFVNANGLKELSGLESTLRIASLFVGWIGLFLLGRWLSNPLAWVVIWIAMAVIFEGFGGALHEAMHDKLYAKRRHNRIAGWIVALPRLFNFPANQAYHLHHHRFTHDPERDSEPVFEKLGLIDYVLYMCFSGVVYTGIIFYQGVCAMLPIRAPWFNTKVQRRRSAVGTVVVLASVAVVVAGHTYAPVVTFQLWLMPWLLCSVVFSFAAQPEHFATDPVPPGSTLTTTRSVRSNPFFGFFLWNNNLHAAHHLVPSLPGDSLPKLHEFIAPHVKYSERSYTRWHLKLARRLLMHPVAASAGTVKFWVNYGDRTAPGGAARDDD